MNKLQQLFENANRTSDNLTNRSRPVKSVNTVLKNSAITISICENGRVWTAKSGMKYNLSISLSGVKNIIWYIRDMTPNTIAQCLGQFLLKDEVKEHIIADITTSCTCGKCEGKGIIPAFYYYAEGICFDCMGAGITGFASISNVQNPKKLTGKRYLKQFYVSKCFYSEFPQGVEKIRAVRNLYHPTAIELLGKKDNDFYIYAPICMRNDWYVIPSEEFERFAMEYLKQFNVNILI